jgi:DNA-binding NarL/FixJ family response regulator
MHSEVDFVAAMLRAGASGYLLKEDAAEVLVEAIHAVVDGQSFLSPGIADSVVELVRAGTRDESSPFSLLSGREREVLQLIAEGNATRQIAGLLHVSERTVGSHRENLKGKLGISSIAGLTRYALRVGLTSIDC